MTEFFNGKKKAKEKEVKLSKKVKKLDINPKMISIQVGEDNASSIYLKLKKQAAKRVGAELHIKKLPKDVPVNWTTGTIKKLNKDDDIDGIMIQLPLPDRFSKEDREEVFKAIDIKKDVDGMRNHSKFVAPVVLAILDALEEAINIVRRIKSDGELKILVVGSEGFVGKKIIYTLKEVIKDENMVFESLRISGVDIGTQDLKNKTLLADVIISTTGEANLITKDMVKKGAAAIDVGAPKGDISKDAYDKLSFVSGETGGVGPLTVYYLMENLVRASN